MLMQHLSLAAGAPLDKGTRVRPDIASEIGKLGTREEIALQSVYPMSIAGIAAEPVDKRQNHPIELAPERMFGIVPDLLEESRRRCHDLVNEKFVRLIKFQQRGQLAANFLADHRHRFG